MAKGGYTINIVGHDQFANSDDAAAFEYGAAQLAHELVTKLAGVTHASFGGSHYVAQDLFNPPKPPMPPHRLPPGPSGAPPGPEGVMTPNPPVA